MIARGADQQGQGEGAASKEKERELTSTQERELTSKHKERELLHQQGQGELHSPARAPPPKALTLDPRNPQLLKPLETLHAYTLELYRVYTVVVPLGLHWKR